MGVRVRAYDPVAMPVCKEQNRQLRITYCCSTMAAAEHADAVVLVTEWPELASLNLRDLAEKMNKLILIDGRNLFDPRLARAAGFDYIAIGRSMRNLRPSEDSNKYAVIAQAEGASRLLSAPG
jgi:UDPglucose 6-dehydrogenase